ncbi:RnfABCDGE type electron transport complex subunit B [Anaerolentibacter hominis]|uniref:RnfABCDGE type electron transport complex subunit B n=1 Tax=Anaerolentibacter hominis TaxID=3079009 RepID=UPI0031B837E9
MGSGIILAAVVVGMVGIVIGLLLGVAGQKLKVEVNETEVAVRECLPGNNCGGCGYPGCDGLAKAIAEGTAPVNACPVAGAAGAKAIGEIMGVEAEETEQMVAFVRCSGTCENIKTKYTYYGTADCKQAFFTPGRSEFICNYGCMGYGTCVKACRFDAIHVVNGIARVDREKCRACGMCVEACPNHLIELVPYASKYLVQCFSKDKGKAVKAGCNAGCIGCTLCTRVCETGAITVENNLAHIDPAKCTGCGKCAEKCPVKVIRLQECAD